MILAIIVIINNNSNDNHHHQQQHNNNNRNAVVAVGSFRKIWWDVSGDGPCFRGPEKSKLGCCWARLPLTKIN